MAFWAFHFHSGQANYIPIACGAIVDDRGTVVNGYPQVAIIRIVNEIIVRTCRALIRQAIGGITERMGVHDVAEGKVLL